MIHSPMNIECAPSLKTEKEKYMNKMVKIYDPVTKKVSTIPQAELGHGMVEVDVVGVGRVWVKSNQFSVEAGPICHPPIGEELMARIRRTIMEPLSEVYPKTLNQWEDGFRRDRHAEREIAIWEIIAQRYTAFVDANKLNKKQRKEVFQLMVRCTNVPNRSAFWETTRPQSLTREQVEAVIAPFEINWRD
jgi:hypothetical protein